jgi:hypothetical protein
MKRFDQQFLARDSESWVGMEVNELVGFLLPKCPPKRGAPHNSKLYAG